jgi:hypothetical protein
MGSGRPLQGVVGFWDSGGPRTQCAGLASKVDVQARHEGLTGTHAPIVRN